MKPRRVTREGGQLTASSRKLSTWTLVRSMPPSGRPSEPQHQRPGSHRLQVQSQTLRIGQPGVDEREPTAHPRADQVELTLGHEPVPEEQILVDGHAEPADRVPAGVGQPRPVELDLPADVRAVQPELSLGDEPVPAHQVARDTKPDRIERPASGVGEPGAGHVEDAAHLGADQPHFAVRDETVPAEDRPFDGERVRVQRHTAWMRQTRSA
ncbi:hypothetical protein ACGFNU_49650 [Spirillospora sp. NPDC048911]|uniref:hypothetical protein n=1 Tax=Spirillospora sp. NPDC048911 TaxID=3364527 RepID=UPI00371CCF6E